MPTITPDQAREAQTPLLDLLRAVPADAVMNYEESPTSSHHIPVGALCGQAVAALEQSAAEVEALRRDAERYRWLRQQHEGHEDIQFDADGLPLPAEPTAAAFTVFYPTSDSSLEPVGCIYGELDAAESKCIAGVYVTSTFTHATTRHTSADVSPRAGPGT